MQLVYLDFASQILLSVPHIAYFVYIVDVVGISVLQLLERADIRRMTIDDLVSIDLVLVWRVFIYHMAYPPEPVIQKEHPTLAF
jgi:hypothetical protein